MTRIPQPLMPYGQQPQLPAMPQWPGMMPMPQQQAAPDMPPEITPEQTQGILGKTLGMASVVGQVLDTPGSILRGFAAGDPERAMGGIFDPEKRVSGSDLLEQWGLLDPKDHSGFHWDDPHDWLHAGAGFATEVGLDPLLLLSGPLGALTKAGKLAEAAKVPVGIAKAMKLTTEAGGALKPMEELLPSVSRVIQEAAAKGISPTTENIPALEALIKEAHKATGVFTEENMPLLSKLLGEEALGNTAVNTPANLAAQIRSGDRGLIGIHAPFWMKPFMGEAASQPLATFGAGSETAANLLEKLTYGGSEAALAAGEAGKVGTALSLPTRLMRGLFSASAAGGKVTFDGLQQIRNDLAFASQKSLLSGMENFNAALGDGYRTLNKGFEDMARSQVAQGDMVGAKELMDTWTTNKAGLPDVNAMAQDIARAKGFTPTTGTEAMQQATDLANRMHSYLDTTQQAIDGVWKKIGEWGGRAPELQDIYSAHGFGRSSSIAEAENYLQRSLARQAGVKGEKNIAKYIAKMKPDIARNDLLRNVPGSQVRINKLATDPVFGGWEMGEDGVRAPLGEEGHIAALKEALGPAGQQSEDLGELRRLYAYKQHVSPEIEKAWADKTLPGVKFGEDGKPIIPENAVPGTDPLQAEIDAGRVRKLDPWKNEGEPRYFTYEGEKDRWAPNGKTMKGLVGALDAMGPDAWEHGIFDRSVAQNASRYLLAAHETLSTLMSAHNYLGQDGIVGRAAELGEGAMPLSRAWGDAGFKAEGLEKFVQEHFPEDAQKILAETPEGKLPDYSELIGDLRMAPGAETGLKNYAQLTSPKFRNAVTDMIDPVSRAFRFGLYTAWPGSAVRNLGTHFWQAWSHGKVDAIMGEGGGLLGAFKRAGQFIGGNLAEEDGRFIREGIEGGVLRHGPMEEIGAAANAKYGSVPESWGQVAKGRPDQSVLGAAATTGARLQEVQNFVSRAGYYDALRRTGYSPGQAGHLVKNALFDYGSLSSFERNALQGRACLFYNFLRRNVPYQFQKLLEEPGGRTAQTLRAVTESSAQNQPDVYTPQFLREGNVIPTSGTPDAQAFYRNTMLPFGELNDVVFHDGKPLLGRTLEKFASHLNPLLLAPMEMEAGKQLTTGRRIEDLESPTKWASQNILPEALGGSAEGTAIPSVDRALHYSPLSRAEGEAWGATRAVEHPYGTAARLIGAGAQSTYNTDQWRLRDMRDALGQTLENTPGMAKWQSYFMPKSLKATAPPEKLQDIARMQKLRELMTHRLAELRAAKQTQGASQ